MAEHDLKDADISRGCRQNNPESWRHLVRRYTPLVYRLALRILKNSQAAEDTAQEKRRRPWSFAGVVKDHFQTMTGIFDRMARAAFLKGHLTGRIGLPDPADTATFGWLCRMVNLPSGRFRLALACDYNEEIIQAEAAARATLIFGYLGLVAGLLLLRSQTRMMLHSLRHA